MLTLADLNKRNYPTTKVIDSNLLVLFQRLQQLETLWIAHVGIGISDGFKCNSGLRSEAQQRDLVKAGKSTALKSKHLLGLAADLNDEDGEIKKWLQARPHILSDIHLWCEAAEACPNWLHVQICPPASGKRWFSP